MKTRPDLPFWLSDPAPRDPSAARAAGGRMPQSPHQLKADRTTSLVREITDAAAKEREAKIKKLRAARLARDSEAPAEPAPAAPRKARAAKA